MDFISLLCPSILPRSFPPSSPPFIYSSQLPPTPKTHEQKVSFSITPLIVSGIPTGHQQDGVFVWMQLHLPGDPRPVEVSVPPALLLALRVFVLVARPDERDAEVALLPVHRHLVLPGRYGRGRVLLGC